MDLSKFDYKPVDYFNVLNLPGLSYDDVIKPGTKEWYKAKYGDGFDNYLYEMMETIYKKSLCHDEMMIKTYGQYII